MATTTSANVIIPEVWGDMAQAEFVGAQRLLASGAVQTSDALVGAPGSTIHFPKWAALNDLSDLTENVAMVPQAMGTADNSATIKEAGTAVELTDNVDLNGLGNPEAEARRQFGILANRKLEADLIIAAQAAGAFTAPSTLAGLTWANIVGGIATFGDDWDPADFAGLFIRAEAQAQLLNDSNFINAAQIGGVSAIRSGQIGVIGGLPVFVTNRLASGKSLLLKKNSLGAIWKRRPLIEQDRDILKRTTVVTITMHYATKRLNNKGVCVLTAA